MSHTYEMNLTDEIKYFHGKVHTFGRTFHYYLYYIDGLLIDTGPPCAKDAVVSFVEKVKPEKVFITHYHEDHSGNASFLHEKFRIPIFSGEKTAKILQKKLSLPLYRRITWGTPSSMPVNSQVIERELATNHYHFQVVPTPGHSHDHMALFAKENGLLFSGDLYLAKKLHFAMKEESIPQLIHSIEHILSFKFEKLFCAHAGIVANGKKALLEKKQFLEQLVNKTTELYQQGHKTKQIAKILLPPQKMLYLFSCGEMSPSHLIRSIVTDDINR